MEKTKSISKAPRKSESYVSIKDDSMNKIDLKEKSISNYLQDSIFKPEYDDDYINCDEDSILSGISKLGLSFLEESDLKQQNPKLKEELSSIKICKITNLDNSSYIQEDEKYLKSPNLIYDNKQDKYDIFFKNNNIDISESRKNDSFLDKGKKTNLANKKKINFLKYYSSPNNRMNKSKEFSKMKKSNDLTKSYSETVKNSSDINNLSQIPEIKNNQEKKDMLYENECKDGNKKNHKNGTHNSDKKNNIYDKDFISNGPYTSNTIKTLLEYMKEPNLRECKKKNENDYYKEIFDYKGKHKNDNNIQININKEFDISKKCIKTNNIDNHAINNNNNFDKIFYNDRINNPNNNLNNINNENYNISNDNSNVNSNVNSNNNNMINLILMAPAIAFNPQQIQQLYQYNNMLSQAPINLPFISLYLNQSNQPNNCMNNINNINNNMNIIKNYPINLVQQLPMMNINPYNNLQMNMNMNMNNNLNANNNFYCFNNINNNFNKKNVDNFNKNYNNNNDDNKNNNINNNFNIIKNNNINCLNNDINNTKTHKNQKIQNTNNNIDNKIDEKVLCNISNGTEKRTTVRIKNIPAKYKIDDIENLINKLLNVKENENTRPYDLIYLPPCKKPGYNIGYVFVNFVDPKHIIQLYKHLNGEILNKKRPKRKCSFSFGNIQGKEDLLKSHDNDKCFPKLYNDTENSYKLLNSVFTNIK